MPKMALSLPQAVCAHSVEGCSLTDKLAWLQRNAESNNAYIIDVNADESIAPHQRLEYSGHKNISITLIGIGHNRSISPLSEGLLFFVDSGVTLVLDTNITIRGRRDNRVSLLRVNPGGTLVMNDGSAISGNTSYDSGGAVFVAGGTFTMNGGEISGNTADDGGAVYVESGGTFVMHGGIICDCSAIYEGGGVYVDGGGIFAMNMGSISGNRASCGGGVRVDGGVFTMNGGIISGNKTNATVVFVDRGGIFSMIGGEICGWQETRSMPEHVQTCNKVTL